MFLLFIFTEMWKKTSGDLIQYTKNFSVSSRSPVKDGMRTTKIGADEIELVTHQSEDIHFEVDEKNSDYFNK